MTTSRRIGCGGGSGSVELSSGRGPSATRVLLQPFGLLWPAGLLIFPSLRAPAWEKIA